MFRRQQGLNLALEGGGAHGAFTWGVLDRLLEDEELEEPRGPVGVAVLVEHLGGVVYDGIWVGEGSKVPNVGGIRRALVEHMLRIKPGVVRWPGGCFAGSICESRAAGILAPPTSTGSSAGSTPFPLASSTS